MSFDLTKPSMTDADWPTFAANIRENLRAIVEGDAAVFTKAADITLQITTTGTTTFSRVATRSGNGTTSARKSYFRAETLETTPQVWHAGMLGTKSFVIRDETATVDRITIDQATGNVGVGATPSSTYKLITTTLHVAGTTNNSVVVLLGTPGTIEPIINSGEGFYFNLDSDNNGSTSAFTIAKDRANFSGGTDLFQVAENGNVVIGAGALATTATTGFLYIDSCAGTPTGVAGAITGRVPIVYDTTNNKLYAYNGGWKSVTLA